METDSESMSSDNSETSISVSNEPSVTNSDVAEKPIEKSIINSETLLPLSESESLSYGLYNVKDPLLLRSDIEATVPEETLLGNQDESFVPTEIIDDLSLDGPTTTEDSSDHSTDSWNTYTESLYDGSTIDDIVEVNAVGLQSIEEGTTVENVDK